MDDWPDVDGAFSGTATRKSWGNTSEFSYATRASCQSVKSGPIYFNMPGSWSRDVIADHSNDEAKDCPHYHSGTRPCSPASTQEFANFHNVSWKTFQHKVHAEAQRLCLLANEIRIQHLRGGRENRVVVAHIDTGKNLTSGIFRIPRFSNAHDHGASPANFLEQSVLN